jgi:hypothetical protein
MLITSFNLILFPCNAAKGTNLRVKIAHFRGTRQRRSPGRDEIEKHDARLRVAHIQAVDRGERAQRGADEFAGVGGRER